MMQIEIWQAIQHPLENHKFHFGHKPSHGESMSCENLSDDLQCCWANILTIPGVADTHCFSYRDSPKIQQTNANAKKDQQMMFPEYTLVLPTTNNFK